jgi:hypothetical protein
MFDLVPSTLSAARSTTVVEMHVATLRFTYDVAEHRRTGVVCCEFVAVNLESSVLITVKSPLSS